MPAASFDTTDQPSLKPPRFLYDLTCGLLALALSLGAACFVLWTLGFFQGADQEHSSQVVAASLALVGVVATAAVTFIGLLLKHSVDAYQDRLRVVELNRLQLDSEHQRRSDALAEERLRVESAVKAIELFQDAAGSQSSPNEKAGALFALSKLGEDYFAMSLLRSLWAHGQITSEAAIWIVNNALQCRDEITQNDAADLLYQNVEQVESDDGYILWPNCIKTKWKPDLSVYARGQLLKAVLRLSTKKPWGDWENPYPFFLLHLLRLIMLSDGDHVVQVAAARAIALIHPKLFSQIRPSQVVLGAMIAADALRSEVRHHQDDRLTLPDTMEQLLEKLRSCVDDRASPPDSSPET